MHCATNKHSSNNLIIANFEYYTEYRSISGYLVSRVLCAIPYCQPSVWPSGVRRRSRFRLAVGKVIKCPDVNVTFARLIFYLFLPMPSG